MSAALPSQTPEKQRIAALLCALGLFTAVTVTESAQAAAPIRKGPYLQSLGTSGVTVKLELDEAAPAKLEVYQAGSEKVVASVESPERWTFHAMHVEGLSAGTAFEYRVLSGGARSELGHFVTAPAENRPFRFQIYGDSRNDGASHAAVVRAMLAQPADFLVNTGDMVHSGIEPGDWAEFFTIEKDLIRDRCVFAAVGNHEIYKGDAAGGVAFLRYFAMIEEGRDRPRLYSSFRWSNTRFFLLNAMDTWTGEERDWLRSELDHALGEPGLQHRIAVLHHGPFSSGPHGPNKAFIDNDIVGMMRERRVDLVVSGHDHVYERGESVGLKYLISGGAGAPLYERKIQAPHTLSFESVHHFVEVTIEGDEIKAVARRASGGIIEACGFHGGGPWSCDESIARPAPTSGIGPAATSAPGGNTRGKGACTCDLAGTSDDAGGVDAGLFGCASLLVFGARRRRGARAI
ncbi:MAG: metallophosphoesterase [Minicystis sp.]